MPFFSSGRERRLWLWTLVVVAGIYATLGLASTLSEVLYSHGPVTVAFLLSMVLVAATVFTQGLRARPAGVEVGVALGIGVVYFLVLLRMTIPERSHLMEYGVVAVFIYEVLTERLDQGRRVPVPGLLAILATSLVGAIDEGIQWILPSRVFEWDDILFNVLAATMATVSMSFLRLIRRWTSRDEASASRH